MNKEQIRLCLKAGAKAGLKLKQVVRFSGDHGIDWEYCTSGHTKCFNPWKSMHDAMLIALACCEYPAWDDEYFTVYPKGAGATDKSMQNAKLSGKTFGEKTWSIGNAIVNAANYKVSNSEQS